MKNPYMTDSFYEPSPSSEGMGEALTLLELNSLVRQVIETTMSREYWVVAELSECRESRGHCYMELIQYDDTTDLSSPSYHLSAQRTPVARASAKCWKNVWTMAAPYFERTTGHPLRAGMKVRLKVYAQFHEAFGFSWIITDIDPTYTMGELARKRQEIIRQLKAEGVFDLQKELELPLFCQHIAVISSETAAGYGDFCQQLNESGFAFQVQLFPAIMQGEGVEQSIISALEQIYSLNTHPSSPTPPFDCVVIIRGGGATADLSGFDTLALAENVANFPIPIITGIGHDRDESILDMVAHLRVKTPTAAAQLLVSRADELWHRIESAQERLVYYAKSYMQTLKARLESLSERLPILFSLVRTHQEARLNRLYQQLALLPQRQMTQQTVRLTAVIAQLSPLASHLITKEQHRLELLEQRAKALDPTLLLQRGYSITLKEGKAVRNAAQLHPGDEIETRLEQGTIKSIVK